MERKDDPDKRITNADEQDVAVNHSTRQEGGFDEPASTESPDTSDPQGKPEGGRERVPEKTRPGIDSPRRKVN